MALCDDTIESKNTNNLISTDGFVYSPTIQIYQIDQLQKDFETIAVKTSDSGVISKFVDVHTQEIFNQGLIAFNNFLLSAKNNPNLNVSVNYPSVFDRLSKGVAITPIEYASFMYNSGYNPVTLQTASNTAPKTVLELYNTDIADSFSKKSMGTFCELAPSIFGAISNFFDSIQNFANKITDIINKIQNFSLASLLDGLKTKIMSVIDNIIKKMKNVIENYSLNGLMSEADKFFHSKIELKFSQLQQNAMKFFNEQNIDNFKKNIEGMLSYAVNIFKDPKLEEIQFLIYRFCSFIKNVENSIINIKAPLDQFVERYATTKNVLKANSSQATIVAVAAGAKRVPDEEVARQIKTVTPTAPAVPAVPAAPATPAVPATPAAPAAPQTYDTTPTTENIIDSVLKNNSFGITREEILNLPVYKIAKAGGDPRILLVGGWTNRFRPNCGFITNKAGKKVFIGNGMELEDGTNPGWELNTTTFIISKCLLMRVQKDFAQQTGINRLHITSAYRSPIYNECLRAKSKGVAKNSQHLHGKAFDIQWPGFPNNRNTLVEIAKKHHFVGFGRYATFQHIDWGSPRSW